MRKLVPWKTISGRNFTCDSTAVYAVDRIVEASKKGTSVKLSDVEVRALDWTISRLDFGRYAEGEENDTWLKEPYTLKGNN